MPEIRTVTTLTRKRRQIAASIKLYERQLAQARLRLHKKMEKGVAEVVERICNASLSDKKGCVAI